MRFMLMGSSPVTVQCLEHLAGGGDEVVAFIVDAVEEESRREFAAMASDLGVAIFGHQALKDKSFYERFSGDQRPDAIFSITYRKKIPREAIVLPKIGAFNWHPSLLPKYRGADPYFWAIRDGESRSGLTVHFVTEEYDAGDIVHQAEIEIGAADTWGMLAARIDGLVLPSLASVVESLRTCGASIPRRAQEQSRATYAPTPAADDLQIDWGDDAMKIARLIRACNPDRAARASFKGKQVLIFKGSARPQGPSAEGSACACAAPGTIIEVGPGSVTAKTGSGLLEIHILQIGWDYLLSGGDFARIEQVRPGDRFL